MGETAQKHAVIRLPEVDEPTRRRVEPGDGDDGGQRGRFWSDERFVVIARVVADLIAICEALLVASYVRFVLRWFEVTESAASSSASHLAASAVWIAAVFITAAAIRLYDEDTLMPGEGEFPRILRSVLESIAILSVFAIFTQTFAISRSWLALVAVLTAVFLLLERLIFRKSLMAARTKGRSRRPALLISKTGSTWPEDFVGGLEDFDVVAHIDNAALQRYLSVGSRREERRSHPDVFERAALIVRASEFDEDELWHLVMQAGQSGSSVFLHSSVRSVGRDRLTVRKISGHTMVKISPPRLHGVKAFQKRTLDVVGSSLLFLLLSPVLLTTAVAVLVTSGRPLLYGQERVGKSGNIFKIWKFRSMRTDAEVETGPRWASEEDPRVTRIGKWLRRTSLDELPQLWNVLRGEMSLVGPRPERPVFVDQFTEELAWYQYRHRIKPGMTGWAQAHGLRGNTSLDSRVEFDNWYIEHWTASLDVQILFRTIWEVLRGEHAY